MKPPRDLRPRFSVFPTLVSDEKFIFSPPVALCAPLLPASRAPDWVASCPSCQGIASSVNCPGLLSSLRSLVSSAAQLLPDALFPLSASLDLGFFFQPFSLLSRSRRARRFFLALPLCCFREGDRLAFAILRFAISSIASFPAPACVEEVDVHSSSRSRPHVYLLGFFPFFFETLGVFFSL